MAPSESAATGESSGPPGSSERGRTLRLLVDGTARLLVEGQRHHPFPDSDLFVSLNGAAPIDASSGDVVRHHRLPRAGNRQINRVLQTTVIVQLRSPTEGRAHYD